MIFIPLFTKQRYRLYHDTAKPVECKVIPDIGIDVLTNLWSDKDLNLRNLKENVEYGFKCNILHFNQCF